jgi:hypothetical protein
MAYPLPPIDGITTQIQTEFIKPLRRPLTGFRLFAGKEFKTDSWTREELKWFKVGDLSDVVVSMDLPPIQSDSGTLTAESVGIPILTKDYTEGGRKAAQAREAGFDPVRVNALGRAMAVEMERILLAGYPANSGGPTTGLLNDAGSPGSVALGAWTDAEAINAGIAKLISEAVQDEMDGPYALVVNRADVTYFQQFISGTNVRIGDNLPGSLPGSLGGIQAILPTTYVNSGTVKLVDLTEGNYHAVSPRDEGSLRFGLGNTTVGEVAQTGIITDGEPLLMTRTWRMINILVPRLVYKEAVQTGTFTAS